MLVLAEFKFDAGNDARIIYEALLPELVRITSVQKPPFCSRMMY